MSEHLIGLSRRAFIGGAFGITAASLLIPGTAFAETAAEKQAEADAVRNQLIGLQADLETAADDYYRALDEQEAAQAAMEQEQVKIDNTNQRIEVLQSQLSDRARSMYRSGATSLIDFVLGAATFEEFTSNWKLLTSMNDSDAEMVDQTKTAREELEAAKAEYANQEQIAADRAAEAQAIQEDVQAKIDNATVLVSQLDAEAQRLLEEEQAAAAAAAAAQAAAEAEARRQAEQAAAAAAAAQAPLQETATETVTQEVVQEDGTVTYEEVEVPVEGDSTDASGGAQTGADAPVVYPVEQAPVVAGDNSAVVGFAMGRIGCPYVWGAEGPDAFDCSGLVTWAYRQIGMNLPHQSEAQYSSARNVVSVSEARPGDVLWRYGHVGIACSYGGEHYVHAPTFGAYVRDTDPLSWSQFTNALQF
ncbi:C40 family peptidase [Xiamenia xianingshaonis]|uniref:C40 family peptidase n=1 Tax=Xiamenia xianingshaonis TaxID=2682776 RepID=A0A9E6MPF5_9ACTN|nr:C40 family peptidase [Xiamenia xianingshaonis]NGM17265.1 hydrolase Nlp/P60 [Eggerthellaceae bacterium zg-893]NHM13985.1 hydrolase Nlp/P60 [Xiamenia xianingshaonis]NHM15903.1 hydrolase Nlp/P60 [Xiamenia xianingshaonis]QTU83861.1 C40 family peptidase [Xiamenia xianingshaonis]